MLENEIHLYLYDIYIYINIDTLKILRKIRKITITI